MEGEGAYEGARMLNLGDSAFDYRSRSTKRGLLIKCLQKH